MTRPVPKGQREHQPTNSEVSKLKSGARRATISEVKRKDLPQHAENSNSFAKQALGLYDALTTWQHHQPY